MELEIGNTNIGGNKKLITKQKEAIILKEIIKLISIMTLKKFHEQEQKLENYLNQIGIFSDISKRKNLIIFKNQQKNKPQLKK
ncbi:hypothetical protein [Flavobacterium sp.]|uniref:hypothetical protein n=1 Tax=Flavobacterium sp. TaxID=239 RepID=UPI0035ADB371